jgi:hypothetical protein
MVLGEKEFEQFVNVYMFRMRNVQPLHVDIARLIAEGHRARLLMEIFPNAKPEYELYVSRYRTPVTDGEFTSMFVWCLKKNALLLRSYLVYILSIEHETAMVTLKWMNELKEFFDLNPKIMVHNP